MVAKRRFKNTIDVQNNNMKKMFMFNKKKYYLIVFLLLLIWAIVFSIYFFSPLSRTSNIDIYCNTSFFHESINEDYFKSYLPSRKVFLPSFDKNGYVKALKGSIYSNYFTIEKFSVTPFSIKVRYSENVPLFKYDDMYYLSNGNNLGSLRPTRFGDFNFDDYLEYLPNLVVLENTDLAIEEIIKIVYKDMVGFDFTQLETIYFSGITNKVNFIYR